MSFIYKRAHYANFQLWGQNNPFHGFVGRCLLISVAFLDSPLLLLSFNYELVRITMVVMVAGILFVLMVLKDQKAGTIIVSLKNKKTLTGFFLNLHFICTKMVPRGKSLCHP